MKSIIMPLFALFALIYVAEGRAQNQKPDTPSTAVYAATSFRFAGVPWGSDVATVKRVMAESHLTFTKLDDDGDLHFQGNVLNQKSDVIVLMSKDAGAVKVMVNLLRGLRTIS
jgi:hypothetical protein